MPARRLSRRRSPNESGATPPRSPIPTAGTRGQPPSRLPLSNPWRACARTVAVRLTAQPRLQAVNSEAGDTLAALGLRFAHLASTLDRMTAEEQRAIIQRVQDILDRSGLLMGQFAEQIGLDGPKLSKSLSGARKFTLADLGRIADLGHVPLDYLAGATLESSHDGDGDSSRDDDWSPADHPEAIALSQTVWWDWAVQLTAERMQTGHGRQQQIDARFFVFALAQLRAAARIGLAANVYPDEVARELQAALDRFDEAVPDIKNARDVLMHMDEYIRGVGNMQTPQANTVDNRRTLAGQYTNGVGYYPADGEARVGDSHYVFNVAEVLDALPHVVWAVHRAGTAVT